MRVTSLNTKGDTSFPIFRGIVDEWDVFNSWIFGYILAFINKELTICKKQLWEWESVIFLDIHTCLCLRKSKAICTFWSRWNRMRPFSLGYWRQEESERENRERMQMSALLIWANWRSVWKQDSFISTSLKAAHCKITQDPHRLVSN